MKRPSFKNQFKRHSITGLVILLLLACLQVKFAELQTKTLVMAVYDFDRFSKHDQIGQVIVQMHNVDLCQTVEATKDIISTAEDKV